MLLRFMVVVDPSLLRDISEPIAPAASMGWFRSTFWVVGTVFLSASVFFVLRKWGIPLLRALQEWFDPGAEVRLTRQVRKFRRNPDRVSTVSLDLWWETLMHILQKRGLLPAASLTFEEVLAAFAEERNTSHRALSEEVTKLVTILERLRYSRTSETAEDTLAGAHACVRILALIRDL